ncbi:AraC family transcriptional regulator [Flavobacterium sp. MK4S-17]|uniref:AraC family transcriptional regulator n=1 Tax=Flavobacterium sp. MK4S-17 TaxID=2543737 RepID=UPI00135BEF03|nr:AraC family transcriptional regulator [Flavobacterium sp. MK4S-17]
MFQESFATSVQDSLQRKDFRYLFTRIGSTKEMPARQKIYLQAFLANAKAAQDWELIATGYKNYADYADENMAIIYSDSMVYAAKQSGDNKLIGSAYLSKGIAFYALKRHELALENYLIAKPYIEVSGDDYLKYKLTYNIAHVKYYLGKNEEAIQLFNSCLQYFKNTNPRAYLNTLHSLGLVYNKAGDYGKSLDMVTQGNTAAKALNNHSMDAYFLHLQGLNEYFRENYASAIEHLKKSIPEIKDNKDHGNVAVANFYIGKSLWDLKRRRESVPYLKHVDEALLDYDYIRPDLRESFELLIDFYKDKGELKQVLYYVDRLLVADSILRTTHDKLYDNIHVNYDTVELRQEKKNIEKQLSQEVSHKKLLIVGSVCLAIIIILLTVALYRHRRRNRIFRELMENKKPISNPVSDAPKELNIPQETVDKILSRLEKWRQSMRYLEPNITRASMAVYLETNVHYVSDVISHCYGKSFTEYINDLKIDYIIEQLKTDKHKRMFTHEALAKEAGFGTTQSFVTAFKARTGISPNFFSAKIRKEMDEKGNQ